MPKLDQVRIAGFKSIRDQTVDLRSLNVLIGANGAGKSNFIAVFRLLHEIVNGGLAVYVGQQGGADRLLHFGRKATEELHLEFKFGMNAYLVDLAPTAEDAFVFSHETVFFHDPRYERPYEGPLGAGHRESLLRASLTSDPRYGRIAFHVLQAIDTWRVHHFHDTSSSARVKQTGDLADNVQLRADAGNLAAFLYRLQETEPEALANIAGAVRMVAPFFDRFELRPDRLNPDRMRLEWRERGSDAYFDAHALSDGTLRFIALATLLLQPVPPTTIVIDEPELGLHPYAIQILAQLLSSAAERTQLVVSTQSVTLVNQLAPEDILIVDREGSESVFRRPTQEQIASWLDDYSLGELWEKNVLGGATFRLKRGYVLVEGQTEETFVRDVLGEHLETVGLQLTPILLSTKRTKAGLKFKGGITSYTQVSREVGSLLLDRQASVVTTMIDFYGLPKDFPAPAESTRKTCFDRVRAAESAFRQAINHPRFLPYLSLHEFEALLLSGVTVLSQVLQSQAVEDTLGPIAASFASPEEIDDGPTTHPAARILAVTRGYRKPLHGPLTAGRIGLPVLRSRCPHFGEWLAKLEALASP